MKRKIIAILLLSIMVFSSFNTGVQAEKELLFPAAIVNSNGEKWGYINQTGAFEIQPAYDFAYDFNDKGIAIVANGKYEYDLCNIYFINKAGKVVSGPFNSFIPEFKNGIAIMNAAGGSSIVVDETGKVVLNTKYKLYEYSDGLINFCDSKTNLYGFMDLTGKIVIPAKYISVQSFIAGKSIVQVSENKYSVIDKSGKVLESLKYYDNYNSAEGFISYYDMSTGTYGYKLSDGTIAIKPKYNSADYFEDGYAVVSIDGKDNRNFGLINKKGEYILKPEYSGIHYLGQGLFAVSKSFDTDFYGYDWVYPKAVFNSNGQQLSDYTYYNVDKFDGDYAVACDKTSSFFIDKDGKIVDTLPKLQGIGKMKLNGDIIKAELEGGLTYLRKNGDIIWQKDETIPLSNNINVKTIKYRRDYITYVEYPEITGMADAKIQTNINAKLKKTFTEGLDGTDNDDSSFEENSVSFSVSKNKNLLIIEKTGYWYPLGAAHGQPSQEYIYIDSKTGVFYQLKDLFKANSKYTDKLTSIVNYQLKLNARIGDLFYYLADSAKVSANQDFIIGTDSIKVYYSPYEIAPYAAGFPEFEIPYGQISSIIDTKGAFWNSFDKKIVNQKTNILSEIEDSKIKSFESLMSSYEKNIIEAINNNNFSKVEGCLLKDSSLYNSQKKLVQSLNKQKIKEKLTKYEIYAISYDYTNNTYKFFVLEQVAVKYPGKDYVNKKYQWCYTAKADSSGNYKLSSIEKW
jgi:hypothetical protein